MKILTILLILAGLVLIIVGLYNAFVPQEVLDLGVLEVNATNGLNSQSLGMIGTGVVALIAGAFLNKRK